MTGQTRIAVVTGAAQGLGLETVRELAETGMQVVLTARRQARIDAALAELGNPANVEGHPLDVADQASVDALFSWLERAHGRIDVLVNNAGRIYGGYGAHIAETDPAAIIEAIDNNALGAYRMIRKALPLMNENGYGRIVNVSSGMGALTDMGGGAIPYRLSKTALNAVTRIAGAEARGNVKINVVCPGWVRTEMGGSGANRTIPEGAAGIVWAATLADNGPNGGFFRDGRPIAW